MQWINEPDRKDPSLVHHALVVPPGAPLAPAFITYWERIFADGCANAAASGWCSLSIDIAERQTEEDTQGYMQAIFRNAQRKECAGVARYFLRSDAFTCLQGRGEDNKTFNRKQSRWLLEQYQLLKDAARTPRVQQLLLQINAIQPLRIEAATSHGWFDLQLGQEFVRLFARRRSGDAGGRRSGTLRSAARPCRWQ